MHSYRNPIWSPATQIVAEKIFRTQYDFLHIFAIKRREAAGGYHRMQCQQILKIYKQHELKKILYKQSIRHGKQTYVSRYVCKYA